MRPRLLLVAGLLGVLCAFGVPSLLGPTGPEEAVAAAPAPGGRLTDQVATSRIARVATPKPVVLGTLRNTAKANAPVAGVLIEVTRLDGTVVGKARTNAQGVFRIVVSTGPGSYHVTLDAKTLPTGARLRNPESLSRTIMLTPGQSFTPIFSIGPDNRHVQTWVDRVPQLAWDGLLFGSVLALASLGLSVIFGTTGLTNFAHGELVTFGALIAYVFNNRAHLPFVLAAVVAVVMSGLLGFTQDRLLWRPLRTRGTGLIAMMIVTIGLSLALRNLYQYFTGGVVDSYRQYVTVEGHDLGPITVAYRDIIIIVVSLATLVAVAYAMQTTRIGRATRAVADNPALAASSGINVNQVISVVWIVGTALAGLSGVFLGFSQQVQFQMGFQVLLLMFAAVTLGGLGTIWGAIIGSLVLGIFIQLSTLVIPAELKNASALVVLIILLLVRPQGLLGRRERVG